VYFVGKKKAILNKEGGKGLREEKTLCVFRFVVAGGAFAHHGLADLFARNCVSQGTARGGNAESRPARHGHAS